MSERTFTTKHTIRAEPIAFSISGDWRKGSGQEGQWTERFSCLDDAPAGMLDLMLSGVKTDSLGRRVHSLPSLLRFLGGVVVPEDEERLGRLIDDKDRIVDIETLGDIVMWLGEEYGSGSSGNRPTTG